MTSPMQYVVMIGHSLAAVHEWRRAFPDRPFLGIRVGDGDIAVLFEPRTASGPLAREVVGKIRQLFEASSDTGAWTSDNQVLICMVPTLLAGHSLATRVLRALHQ